MLNLTIEEVIHETSTTELHIPFSAFIINKLPKKEEEGAAREKHVNKLNNISNTWQVNYSPDDVAHGDDN